MSVHTPAMEAESDPVCQPNLLADIQLDHQSFPLLESVRIDTDLRVIPEYSAPDIDGREWMFAVVVHPDGAFANFEAALAGDSTIRSSVCTEQYPTRRVYKFELAEDAQRILPLTVTADARVLDQSIDSDGWHLTLHFEGRDDLLTFNEACGARDITVRVHKLRLTDEEETAFVGLTDKQQDLLEVAHANGYFDVPRRVSQNELADELGVSKSAVSQRMRRAMSELVAETLANGSITDQ